MVHETEVALHARPGPKVRERKASWAEDATPGAAGSGEGTVDGGEEDDASSMLRCIGLPVAFGGGAKKRRRERKRRREESEQAEVAGCGRRPPDGMREGEPLSRYWRQRYLLWSRFDEGVGMDAEGWWSVTPERVASHQARRMGEGVSAARSKVVVDAFCGCGGNAVQLAQVFGLVVAVDTSPERLALARANAALYGVDARIDFVLGDCRDVLRGLRDRGAPVDACFLSPPWGGPAYLAAEGGCYDVRVGLGDALGCGPGGVAQLLRACLEATPNVALFLPRNTDMGALAGLLGDAGVTEAEVEACALNGRPKALTVYTGALVAQLISCL